MASPQTRLQGILEQLEGAYKKAPLPSASSNSGQALPHGMSEEALKVEKGSPAPANPRMTRILENLEGAYPSSYQMFASSPPAEKPKSGVGTFLHQAFVDPFYSINAGIARGFAFIPDLAVKLTQRAAAKSWQEQHDQISNGQIRSLAAKGIDSSKLPAEELLAAKAKAYEELGPKDAYIQKWVSDKNLTWKLRDWLLKQAEGFAAQGIPVTENKLSEVFRKTYEGIGQAGATIPWYIAGGPYSMAAIGTLQGIAETGTPEGAVLGGIEGALTQGAIHAVGMLPSSIQLPTWFGFGVATTPGDISDRVAGGLTWSALGVSGQKGKEKVTLREFIERYPRWKKRVDDASAVKVLQSIAPDITQDVIDAAGGGKALLDRVIAHKDKFAAILEVFKKSGNDSKALEAMLNKPDMVPLFRDLMGVTATQPSALPERTPSTPARFQVTPEGEVTGVRFPEDQLIRIRYREQELGRRMTPQELAAFFEEQKPPAPTALTPKPSEAPKPGAKSAEKAPEKPAAPAKTDMEIQMMTPEEAAKADVDDFKRWMNPRFRFSYDPTSESDMAAYKDLVKALGLRGDGTVLEDVSRRLKIPEKPPSDSTPQAPSSPAPPASAPSTPPVPASPVTVPKSSAAKAAPIPEPAPKFPSVPAGPLKSKSAPSTSKRDQIKRTPTSTPLLTWIRRQGGIQIDENVQKLRKGELLDLQESNWRRLFRKKGGRSIFELQEMAIEDGRLKTQDENEFWKAIEDEVRGRASYYSEAERLYFGDDLGKPRERTAEEYRTEAVDAELQAWLNGRDVSPELAKDVEAEVSRSDNAEALRRQRAENLKRNELLAALEKEGQLTKKEIEDFLDDTFYDGKKARELAREVMDGEVDEADAKAELKRRVDDMVTDFRPEELEKGGGEELPIEADLGEGEASSGAMIAGPEPAKVSSPSDPYRKLLAEAEAIRQRSLDLAAEAKVKGSPIAAEAEARARETEEVIQKIKDQITEAEAKIGETRGPALEPTDTTETLREKLSSGMVLFHGHGIPKPGERFNTGAGSFGRGKYYTSSAMAAKVYGEVAAERVTLKNPLILPDAEVRRMAVEYGTRKGTPEERLKAAQAMTTDLIAKGHDGLVRVVRGADGEIYEIEVADYTPYVGKAKARPAEAPRVAQGETPFSLKQEPFSKPEAPESKQGSLFEANRVEKTYPPGFDNRGIRTWPDQESMRSDLKPLISQGWVAESGETKDGRIWARLAERRSAGEGELKTESIKPPEFGSKRSEDPQLSLDDELSGSLLLNKAEPLKSTEDLEVREPRKEPELDEFDKWYQEQMNEYDRAIAATPEGKVKAFKLYIEDDTGTDRFYGTYPEEARAELERYAKEKGVQGKVKLGPTFNARAEAVDQSKELEVPKDLMDWVAESGQTFSFKEEARKYEREILGGESENDPTNEVFAGLGVPREIRQKVAKLYEKLDIEAMFKRLKAKATGLSVKLYHTRKNREFELAEKAVKDLKGIAQEANGGKDLSPADYQRIFILASKPRAFSALSEPEKARLGPIVRATRAFFDNYIPRLRQAGVIEDPWPLSAIRRMRAELQDYRERVARGARNSDALREKITERERAIKFLETTGVRYVHIPRYWLEAFFNARPEQAPRVLSQLFGQRETLDIEWLANKLITDGLIQPTDLDVRRIMLMYSHSAGHKIALGQIIKDAKVEGLILPAEDAPETWPRLAAKSFPSLKGYRMNPEMLEFMERNYLKSGWKPPQVGALMGVIKMAQFWNPLNLSQYSLIQTMWTGAVTTLKMPKVFSKALVDMTKKTPDYWEASYWGAFPDPFSPTFRQAAARARTIVGEDPILKKVLTKANPYHWSLMAAWKMENFFKMASYNYLKEKGFSAKEAAQLAALAGGDYATLPPATRKTLNAVLFTPSFTIAMMKAQGEMLAAGAKIMAKPKLLFDKTGDAKYLRQMAKGAVFLTTGLVLKNVLMNKMGYKTDVFGLKWSKKVEDEEGNERELVVHMAAPDNVIIRYLNDLRLVGQADNKAKALWDRATWKLHPMWTTALEILSNKRMDGAPVWDPWDSRLEGQKKALVYVTRRLIRIAELLPEDGGGNLSKIRAYKALQEDLGKIGGMLLGAYSIPYLRSTSDRRLMYEMNNLLDVFKQANKAAPPKNDAEAEERAQWLQDTLEKIRQRIEEIRE